MSIFREHKTVADRSASNRYRLARVEVTCLMCSKIFAVKPSYAKRAKYCSKSCSSSQKRGQYKERAKIKCNTCHKIFEKLPCHKHIKFCSVECKGKSYKKRTTVSCAMCNKPFETTPAKNKTYCSRRCAQFSLSSGKSLEAMKRTNIQKYGVEYISQAQEIKHKKHTSMKRNRTYGKSKVEDFAHDLLIEIFGKEEVERQHSINGWAIDFYVRSAKTYLQIDGVYWHGLDRSLADIKTSGKSRDSYILANRAKDEQQNQWFLERNLNLIRITDKQIKGFKNAKSDLANILGVNL